LSEQFGLVALDRQSGAPGNNVVMGRGRVGGLEQRSFLYRVINFED